MAEIKAPFNKLTPAEAERLDWLAEECAEVILAISKIKRHGYDSHHPENSGNDNRYDLNREIGHISAVVDLMVSRGDVSFDDIHRSTKEKLKYADQYLHHNSTLELAQ
jgi:hypothetical protein